MIAITTIAMASSSSSACMGGLELNSTGDTPAPPPDSLRSSIRGARALADGTVDLFGRRGQHGFGRQPRREVDLLDEVGELGQRRAGPLAADVVEDLARRPDAPQPDLGQDRLGGAAVELKHALADRHEIDADAAQLAAMRDRDHKLFGDMAGRCLLY